jgi:hypothetical protein
LALCSCDTGTCYRIRGGCNSGPSFPDPGHGTPLPVGTAISVYANGASFVDEFAPAIALESDWTISTSGVSDFGVTTSQTGVGWYAVLTGIAGDADLCWTTNAQTHTIVISSDC